MSNGCAARCLDQQQTATTFDEVESREAFLERCNRMLAGKDARYRTRWALENLPGNHVLSSSFGAQAAVAIHLLTRERPDIPVVLIDTGYLFPETYRFVDELAERFELNLKVYRPTLSAAWQEARHGRRWEQGAAALAAYNADAKVAPMREALKELAAGTWFSGLRRSQSVSRKDTAFVQWRDDRYKFHPIADWNDRDVHRYLVENDLPYHPLWEKGYVSIGDHHTTRPIHEAGSLEATRFFGLKRECGLHDADMSAR